MTTSNAHNVDNGMIPTCIQTKGSSSSCSHGRQSLCRLIEQRKEHWTNSAATRIAPSLLGHVKVQPPAGNLVVGPVNRPLELGPEAFDGVRVDFAAHVFPAAMLHMVVLESPPLGVVVDGQFIGVERRADF